jgi:hypothetical protein
VPKSLLLRKSGPIDTVEGLRPTLDWEMDMRHSYFGFMIAVTGCVYASAAMAELDEEPFSRKRLEYALLIDEDAYYAVNMRMDAGSRFRFYLTRLDRQRHENQRQYSDVPAAVIPEEQAEFASAWILGDRIYVVAPPAQPQAPFGNFGFDIHDYPWFVAGQRIRVAARTGMRNERGETVQLTEEEERKICERIAEAMRRGDTSERGFFDGRNRFLFHDSLTSPPGELGTCSVAFVPHGPDDGAVAVLRKDGRVFYFRYRYENNVFLLYPRDIEAVGQVQLPCSRIFLTADDRIAVEAAGGLVGFDRLGGNWSQSEMAPQFTVTGRVWDRTTGDYLLLDVEAVQAIRIGSLTPDKPLEAARLDSAKTANLRAQWLATRPLKPARE